MFKSQSRTLLAALILFVSQGVVATELVVSDEVQIRMPEKVNRACQRETGSFVLSSRPCHQIAATMRRIRAQEEINQILEDSSWSETMMASASAIDTTGSE